MAQTAKLKGINLLAPGTTKISVMRPFTNIHRDNQSFFVDPFSVLLFMAILLFWFQITNQLACNWSQNEYSLFWANSSLTRI